MTTAPIDSVCSLEGEQLEDRLTMIRRDLLPQVRETRERANGLTWVFDISPGMRTRLDDFEKFERVCCGSLQWEVRETDSELHMIVEGVDPRAFRARIEATPGSENGSYIARAAKAAGVGFGGAVLICCALPMSAALALGAGVAAPFLLLDDPIWVAVGTFALAVPVWFLLGRKRETAVEPKSGPGCGC